MRIGTSYLTPLGAQRESRIDLRNMRILDKGIAFYLNGFFQIR